MRICVLHQGKRSAREGGVATEIWVIPMGKPMRSAKSQKTAAGYLSANWNLDPLELDFLKDFWTHDTPHKRATLCSFQNFKKLIFESATEFFSHEGVARELSFKFQLFFKVFFLILKVGFLE